MTTQTSFDIGNLTVKVSIEFRLTPYHPATWYDPAEGGEVEDTQITIDEVLDENGNNVVVYDEAGLIKEIGDRYQEKIDNVCEEYAVNHFDDDAYYRDED